MPVPYSGTPPILLLSHSITLTYSHITLVILLHLEAPDLSRLTLHTLSTQITCMEHSKALYSVNSFRSRKAYGGQTGGESKKERVLFLLCVNMTSDVSILFKKTLLLLQHYESYFSAPSSHDAAIMFKDPSDPRLPGH